METRPRSEQAIEEEIERVVGKALMTGVALTKPAWKTVPVDPHRPDGEMRSVVSTDVTPLRDHIAAALSPLLNRVRAEALREARDNVRASSFWADGSDNYADRVRGYLSNAADRIEQNSEGNET